MTLQSGLGLSEVDHVVSDTKETLKLISAQCVSSLTAVTSLVGPLSREVSVTTPLPKHWMRLRPERRMSLDVAVLRCNPCAALKCVHDAL